MSFETSFVDVGRNGRGVLYDLNPLSKITAVLPVMVVLIAVTDPYTPTAFIIASAFFTLLLGRIAPLQYGRITLPLVGLAVGFALTYPLAVGGTAAAGSPVLFTIGPFPVHEAGVVIGLTAGLRILSVMVLSMMFVLTTDTETFVRAMIQHLGLPYRVGYGAIAAFRFVPMIRSDLETIQAAHRIRGAPDRSGLRGRVARARRYVIPLFVNAIRRAERTALAMDGRAFGAFDDRTSYRRTTFRRADWLFVAGFWTLSVGILLGLRNAGMLEILGGF